MVKTRIRLDTATQLRAFVNLCSVAPCHIYLSDGTKTQRVSGSSMLGALVAQTEWEEIYAEYSEEHSVEFERQLAERGLLY